MKFYTEDNADRLRRKAIAIRADNGEWFRPIPEKIDLGPGVKILPTLPWMRYRYTCPKCNCHAVTKLGDRGLLAGELVMCSNCEYTWQDFS